MQETWVRFLGLEDPLEKEMATYSSILAWRIPWTEGPGELQSLGLKELDMTEQLTLSFGGFPDSSAGKKIHLLMQETPVWFPGREDPPEKG